MVAPLDEAKIPWVGFNLVKGIGPIRLHALVSAFGDIQAAWQAAPAQLEEAGLQRKLVGAMLEIRSSGLLENTLKKIEDLGIQVLTWEDPGYPARLKEIEQSPPVLYCLGSITEQDRWAVAVVGTRKVSTYGKQVTREIVNFLSQNGITIVSGMARGIDGTAHLAALEAGGRTIAVLGNGLDCVYPPEHRQLMQRVQEKGALVSDYPPGTAPEAANFPPRNRIISGLSQAVLVMEAGEKSGAMITAAFAAEQGREVFAVPGSIFAPQSKGTNQLIREGAHILLSGQDVLEVLNLENLLEHHTARSVLPANATEARLMNVLGGEPLYIDDIQNVAALPIDLVSATLTLMELKGMVRKVGPMRYMAVHENRADYEAETSVD